MHTENSRKLHAFSRIQRVLECYSQTSRSTGKLRYNALGVLITICYTEDSLHQGLPHWSWRYREYRNYSIPGRVLYIEGNLYLFRQTIGSVWIALQLEEPVKKDISQSVYFNVFFLNNASVTVFFLKPRHRSGHPESYLFSLLKKSFLDWSIQKRWFVLLKQTHSSVR